MRGKKNSLHSYNWFSFWLSLCSKKYSSGWLKICTLLLFYSQIWLNLPWDDRHFFYIFLWMIITPGYKQKFLKKNTDHHSRPQTNWILLVLLALSRSWLCTRNPHHCQYCHHSRPQTNWIFLVLLALWRSWLCTRNPHHYQFCQLFGHEGHGPRDDHHFFYIFLWMVPQAVNKNS